MISPAPFPPELRTASVVPRWSVVWTLNKDSVANHSYYVAMYARHIAVMIGLCDKSSAMMADLMYMALIHDLDETVSGDIVSPVKTEILDREKYDNYVWSKMKERMPVITEASAEINAWYKDRRKLADEIHNVIKAADRLDALLFLVTERRMGNGVIAPRIPLAWQNLEKAWFDLPAHKSVLQKLWDDDINAAVMEHTNIGGSGV